MVGVATRVGRTHWTYHLLKWGEREVGREGGSEGGREDDGGR